MIDKARLVAVTDPYEIAALTAHGGDLGAPFLVIWHDRYWADADELRAWRLQNTLGTSA